MPNKLRLSQHPHSLRPSNPKINNPKLNSRRLNQPIPSSPARRPRPER